MLQIRDLVHIDEDAEFRNDVQLSAYEEPQRNRALLRSYLFSSSAPRGRTSSVGILEEIINTFLSSRRENRLVTVAGYGHGKSHLALALANYFGRPYRSEEFEIIMEKLGNALGQYPARVERLRQFKENRGEFLVIRLRGDVAGSLHEQFMAGLSQGLQEHESTRDVELPFWYSAARKFLQGLSGEYLDKANAFLEMHSLDVPLLIQQVERKKNVHDLCVNLFRYLHGIAPDFGRETGLDNAIDWVVNNLCGEGKPLAGLIILFDEFSLFIQKYAYKNTPGELQELLNGVSRHQQRAVFVAFAQHDPITTAEATLKAGQGLESLKKELTRLPRRDGYLFLYSLLESVIDAYLTQPKDVWDHFLQNRSVAAAIARATDLTYDLFSLRYDRTLNWGFERFQETVGRGCYPLHPLTTALLSNLNFQDASTDSSAPRTVLGFVLQELDNLSDEPAIQDGRLQWVLPIRLVDYFEERLGGDRYQIYFAARQAIGAGAPEEQKNVLKALYLQEMANLDVRGSDQLVTLAEMAGLDSGQVKSVLRTLSEQKIIRYNPITKTSSFYNRIIQPDRLEEALQREINKQDQSWEFLNKICQDQFDEVPIDVPWGEPNDWAALETVMPYEFFEANTLKNLAQRYSAHSRGIDDGVRGCLVWLIARDEQDIDRFREHAAKVIDDAFPGDNPFPMVLVIPDQPNPDFLALLKRRQALKDLPKSVISEIGQDVFKDEEIHLQLQILEARERFVGNSGNYLDVPRQESVFVIPAAYRASVRAKNLRSVRMVLKEVYHLAYQYAPPEFFTQYRVVSQGSNKLKDAVKTVGDLLLHNGVGPFMTVGRPKQPVPDLIEKFLQNRWQLLGGDFRIQSEPGNSRIRKAWNVIDHAFKADGSENPVKNVLTLLLNVPYGYDYNTLTLLFCAWFGYNAHNLRLFSQGKLINNDTLAEWLAKNPKELITQLCCADVTIVRQDEGEVLREVRSIIDRVRSQSFSQFDAKEALIKLEKFINEPYGQEDLKNHAQDSAENLRTGLKVAEEYDVLAREIDREIKKSRTVTGLLPLLSRIGKLPRLLNVQSNAPAADELLANLKSTLTLTVETECEKYSRLEKLTNLGLNQELLKGMRKRLSAAGLSEYIPTVDSALQTLDQRAKALEAKEKENAIRKSIEGISVNATLCQLRVYLKELREISGLSEATMKLRDSRLKEVEKRIEAFEAAASQWSSDLDKLTSLSELDDYRDRLLRINVLYRESEFEEAVQSALEKCNQLRDFFLQLETLETGRYLNPAEIQQALDSLAKIEKVHADQLSEGQCKKIETTRRVLHGIAAKKEQQADAWLTQREQEFNSGIHPGKLLSLLKFPPAFLSSSGMNRLEQLLEMVQERLDQDVVTQIEAQFLQISDRRKQVECLERLQRILSQERVDA